MAQERIRNVVRRTLIVPIHPWLSCSIGRGLRCLIVHVRWEYAWLDFSRTFCGSGRSRRLALRPSATPRTRRRPLRSVTNSGPVHAVRAVFR